MTHILSKKKLRFFSLGSIGSFQGVLNPLTGLNVFEVFVIPILLYGCETWILTPALLSKFEKLRSEVKRILKLSKQHADLIGLYYISPAPSKHIL